MATLYWGGGTGTWDGFTTANWYTDLARTVLSTRAPSSEDDVIFDAVSNATAYTVTIANSTTVCRSCTIAGPLSGNLTLAGSTAWYIYGNLTLPATGLTRTFTSVIFFYGTGAQTITTNGVSLASGITFEGSGTYTLQSALTTGGSVNINAGTFDTNGNNLSAGGQISSSTTTTGTLTLGASTVSATSFSPLGPLTVNAGTSNISLTSSGLSIGTTAGSTFYNVTFTGLSSLGSGASFVGDNTFNNLTFNVLATALSPVPVVFSGNQTINGTLSVSGQISIRRYLFRSNVIGTTRSLTVAAVASLTDVDFRDIAVAGASAPWSGTRLGDCGGNTNITFPAAKTVYWNGTTGGSWTGNFWAASSGGAVNAANFPLAQDTAIFGNTGLNAGAAISGGSGFNIGTLTSTRTLAWNIGASPIVYGDVTLTTSTTASAFSPIFSGRVAQNFTSAGNLIGGISFNGYNASVKLADNLTVNTVSITAGGLDTDSKNLTVNTSVTVAATNTGPFSLALGSSAVSIAGANGFSSISATAPAMTVSAGTSTITLTIGSASFGFLGQTLTWYNVTRSAASTGSSLLGSNTFNNLTFTSPTASAANALDIVGNQTVNGTLSLGGGTSAAQRMFLRGSPVGAQRIITAATVTGLSDVDFRDVVGAGAATWTGGTRIGDCGNNSGIGFDAPKTVYWNLAGTQNWSANGWATTSTGIPAVNNFPLAQDTATFTDAGSAGTVTFSGTYNIGTIDASGRTSAITLAGSSAQSVYGNVTYGAGVTASTTSTFNFSGSTSQTFTTAGKSISSQLAINRPTCVFSHGDAYTSTGAITVISGSYNTQNYNITTSGFASSQVTEIPRSVTFGTSAITITGASPVNFTGATGLAFSGASSTINLSTASGKTFAGGGQTFGTVSSTGGTINPLTISGSNTFNTLTNSAYTNLIFTRGTTQTVTNFTYTGASGNQVRWYTSIPGQQATLAGSSANIGANSVNGGNNTDFIFTGSSPDYFYLKDLAFVTGVSPNVTVNVTGVSATGQVGTVIIPNVFVQAAGVEATGAVGSVTVSFGAGVTVQPAGVSATGEVGTVFIPSGVSVVVQPTGVSATGEIGTVTVVAIRNIVASVTGVEATGAVGDVIATGGAITDVTGVEATGAVGTVTVVEGQGITVTLTGVSATGAVGTVTVIEGQGVNAPVTGVLATGFVGTVTVTGTANVFPTGVVGYGLIGTVNVWGLVDDIQNADWQSINDTQSANWQIINNTQPSTWTQIPT